MAERVLLVDDDAALLAVMKAHLLRQGYTVEAFSDGYRALASMDDRQPYAVMVTDLDMPALHGQELLRLARQRDPQLEVVVVTGNGTVNAAVNAMRAEGAYDFLVKPFETLSVLSLAVGRAAAHRQLLRERAALTERLNALLLHTGDAILSADLAGRLQVVNPAALQLLGAETLVGRPAAEALPRPLASLLANWQAVGQEAPLTVETAGPGQAHWLVSLAPLPSEGWVMIVRDVTLLKRLDDARYQMLSEAASRLQLPLAQAISNMAELNALVGSQDPRVAGLLFRQTGVWDRIQHWLYDMLQVMRIEAGLDLRPVDVDLAAALPEITRGAPDRGMQDRRVTVEFRVAADLPHLRVDLALLRQMVTGLIHWAGRRSPVNGNVCFSATLQGSQICLEVADDGPALAETDVARLFERSVDLGDDGSGLELALVKSVVDQLGGQVWARRQTRGGAIVVFLPRPAAAASADYV